MKDPFTQETERLFREKFPRDLHSFEECICPSQEAHDDSIAWNVEPEKILAFVHSRVSQAKRAEIRRVEKILDGNKEVYRDGDNKGEEKYEYDSCCNETINTVLSELQEPEK